MCRNRLITGSLVALAVFSTFGNNEKTAFAATTVCTPAATTASDPVAKLDAAVAALEAAQAASDAAAASSAQAAAELTAAKKARDTAVSTYEKKREALRKASADNTRAQNAVTALTAQVQTLDANATTAEEAAAGGANPTTAQIQAARVAERALHAASARLADATTTATAKETAFVKAESDLESAYLDLKEAATRHRTAVVDAPKQKSAATTAANLLKNAQQAVIAAAKAVSSAKASAAATVSPASCCTSTAPSTTAPANAATGATATTATPALAVSSPLSSKRSIADAFQFGPYVREIKRADDLKEMLQAECLDDNPNGAFTAPVDYEPLACCVRRLRFDAAAHFPIPTFNVSGEPYKEQGAVIYEGMQFAAYDAGNYRVRFVVETPAMPVVMRMQLVLSERKSDREFTVTLPAINIPSQQELGRAKEALFLVQVNGYSPAIKHNLGDLALLSRKGTARFGFGLTEPQEDPNQFPAY